MFVVRNITTTLLKIYASTSEQEAYKDSRYFGFSIDLLNIYNKTLMKKNKKF
jgi:hypothetical protein